ncbi:hypothetical protein Pst134EA_001123 [Puccinia striiformis f. sp. tritici]|uniref:hypothetical protein n=1 Tax=Puccinia striiformis f. sp. tritici TaxID=168172 RepID=UPI0020080F15|nr:hypothetical protein Pst134EA_001123 [Puccinia striiformis f. sp. tritici]KAH9474072.1 hypothetical protein Pst134EA_001123 [Puccinia striiformis f. sp. tritici]
MLSLSYNHLRSMIFSAQMPASYKYGTNLGGWLLVRKIPKPGGRPLQCAIAIISNRSSCRDVQFYKDHNYQRALTWSAVVTSMSHLDTDFSSVVAIECINEPLSDASLTPGLEQYYSDFVTITRVVEFTIGVKCEADLRKSIQRLSHSKNALAALQAAIPLIVTYAGKGKPELSK